MSPSYTVPLGQTGAPSFYLNVGICFLLEHGIVFRFSTRAMGVVDCSTGTWLYLGTIGSIFSLSAGLADKLACLPQLQQI